MFYLSAIRLGIVLVFVLLDAVAEVFVAGEGHVFLLEKKVFELVAVASLCEFSPIVRRNYFSLLRSSPEICLVYSVQSG